MESTQYAWCAAAEAVAHVFVASLADEVIVDGRDGHHLQRVRRLRAGEAITAADGTGAWRRYTITAVAPGRLELQAAEPARVEPDLVPAIALAIALTKGGIDHVVARATELGVARVEPVRARRSVVRWDVERAAAAVARLQTIAREAAAQCRRAQVPDIAPVGEIAGLVGRSGLVIADRSGLPASALANPGPAGWTVLVGPEGGFDPADLEPFTDAVPRLAVGPHVLRAETAPLAVVAALRGRDPGRFV